MRYLVATDGACKGNPGPGTWAFVVFDTKTEKMLGHKKGHNPSSTNNEMELISTLGHLHGDLKVTLGLGDLQVRQLGSGDRRRDSLLGFGLGITRRFGKTASHLSNTPTNATQQQRESS